MAKEEKKEVNLDELSDDQLVEAIEVRGLVRDVIQKADDDDIQDAVEDRSLHHLFESECEEDHVQDLIPRVTLELSDVEKQKLELFVDNQENLSWEQWNYIFKDVQRRTPAERAKMPKDYSLVLEESIS